MKQNEIFVNVIVFCSLLFLFAFGWGPISFLTDKWNGYWDGLKGTQVDTTYPFQPSSEMKPDPTIQARVDAAQKAIDSYCKQKGYAGGSYGWDDPGTTTPMIISCFYSIPNPNK